MKKISIFLILSTFLSLTSCKIHFTPQHKKEIGDIGIGLNKIQFYNDKKIKIERQINLQETRTAKGKVKIRDGKHFETIVFPAKTAGIYIDTNSNENCLNITFEQGKYLVFCQFRSDHFYLSDGETAVANNGSSITYGGEKWIVLQGADARLNFKRNHRRKQTSTKRRVSGVMVK